MSFDNCIRCKEPLREVKYRRTKPMQCSDCGSIRIKSNWKDIQEECKAKSVISEDEMLFEDSPVALSEVEYGRVAKKATEISYGASPLSEVMAPTSVYAHKHGSATQGTRFTFTKVKK